MVLNLKRIPDWTDVYARFERVTVECLHDELSHTLTEFRTVGDSNAVFIADNEYGLFIPISFEMPPYHDVAYFLLELPIEFVFNFVNAAPYDAETLCKVIYGPADTPLYNIEILKDADNGKKN